MGTLVEHLLRELSGEQGGLQFENTKGREGRQNDLCHAFATFLWLEVVVEADNLHIPLEWEREGKMGQRGEVFSGV